VRSGGIVLATSDAAAGGYTQLFSFCIGRKEDVLITGSLETFLPRSVCISKFFRLKTLLAKKKIKPVVNPFSTT